MLNPKLIGHNLFLTHHRPCCCVISPRARTGSTAQDDVVPIVALRKNGSNPAARSSSIAAERVAGFRAQSSSAVVGSRRQRLMPAIMHAFFTQLCACRGRNSLNRTGFYEQWFNGGESWLIVGYSITEVEC